MIFSFLQTYITRIAIVVLLAAVGASGIYNVFQHRSIIALNEKLQTGINNQFITTTNLLSAKRTIASLNYKIGAAVTTSNKLQDKINTMRAKLGSTIKQDNVIIQELSNKTAPSSCIAAKKFLYNGIKDIIW